MTLGYWYACSNQTMLNSGETHSMKVFEEPYPSVIHAMSEQQRSRKTPAEAATSAFWVNLQQMQIFSPKSSQISLFLSFLTQGLQFSLPSLHISQPKNASSSNSRKQKEERNIPESWTRQQNSSTPTIHRNHPTPRRPLPNWLTDLPKPYGKWPEEKQRKMPTKSLLLNSRN